jgi:hypothetical protein
MMRLYRGTVIQNEMPRLTAAPLVLPHIPEEPTAAEAEAVAHQLSYGIHYYLVMDQVDQMVRREAAEIRHELQAVLSINWLVSEESSLVVVYIHGVPYTVAKDWLLENAQVA